jgi:hypothetical protein
VAEPTARREIEIRLKFLADAAAGSAAMKQLAADAQRLDTVAKRAGTSVGNVWEQATAGGKLRSSAGGMGGVVGGIGSGISNLAQGGMFGNTMGMVAGRVGMTGGLGIAGGIGLAALAGQQYMQTATSVVNTANDPYLTSQEKYRAFARQLPFGETIQGYFDAYDGRKGAYQEAEEEFQRKRMRSGVSNQIDTFNMGYNPQQFALDARAQGLARATPVNEGYINRSTSAGEKEYRDRQRLIPIEKEIAKAQRESTVATVQRVASQKEMEKLDRQSRDYQNEMAKLREREEKGPQSGPKRQEILNSISATKETIENIENRRRQAAEMVAGAKNAEGQAVARVSMAEASRFRSNAESLEGKAERAESGAQRLGGMDRFARAGAIQSLKLLQQFGPDYLDPSQLAQAQSLAPQTVAKILGKQGSGLADFSELREIAPLDFEGDPETLRREAADEREKFSRRELDAETKLAETAASAGREMGMQVVRAMRDAFMEAINGLKNELTRARGPGT